MYKNFQVFRLLTFSFAVLLISLSPSRVCAQNTYDAERDRALQLLNESKVSEALPLLQKLAKEHPEDAEVTFGLGFCLLAKANIDPNVAERKEGRKRAREILLRSKQLGFDHPLLHSILEVIAPDGGSMEAFSKVKEADDAMQSGEAAFVQGNFDLAITNYKRALDLDPQLYEAALFVGDMYNKKNQPELGSEWFARATKINPNRETAYRYWGVGLLKQGKMIEARDKFIEAYISEPFNRLAINNLTEWANLNDVSLGHPNIEVPANVSSSGSGGTNIEIGDRALTNRGDGSAAWMVYGLRRSVWMNSAERLSEKFSKAYPAEKTYRHSLAEEVDGLRGTVEAVSIQLKDNKISELEPSLATLVKLNDGGLLESYVLLARSNQGLARDYAEYLRNNREKLRRYVIEYVIHAK